MGLITKFAAPEYKLYTRQVLNSKLFTIQRGTRRALVACTNALLEWRLNKTRYTMLQDKLANALIVLCGVSIALFAVVMPC